MVSSYQIGVDGGGTKTECILVDAGGEIAARHLAPGCNPSVVGAEQARMIVTDSLCTLRDQARVKNAGAAIAGTRLFMAGAQGFWQEFAASHTDFGRMRADADSLPVLELATDGAPGLVIHAGTGSFVAARGPDGAVHYAGGIGWRFGDPGSGYELGRRAIARALLELQGWQPRTRLAATVRDHTQLGDAADAGAVTRFFYQHAEPNRVVAALAPAVLRLATEGDSTALALVTDSAAELLAFAVRVASKLFPGVPLDGVRAGLSGALLTHPLVAQTLAARTPFALSPITDAPIEGVRRLLVREKPEHAMLVRFTKNAPNAKADTLTCVRPDGSSTHGEMPRQGILPHDAFHFVVETTLGWRDAFFGEVAAGLSLDHRANKLHGVKPAWQKSPHAFQAESLVECLQAEQWGGAADPAMFTETLAVTCLRRDVPSPKLDAAQLTRVRTALREFGAAWRPLSPGQSLERTF